MQIRRASRRWIATIVIMIALLAAAGAVLRGAQRQISYDRERWLAADTVSGSERYRMAEAVIRRAREERWALSEVVKELGDPTNGAVFSEMERGKTPAILSYYVGVKPGMRLVPHRYVLRLHFAPDGRVYAGTLTGE